MKGSCLQHALKWYICVAQVFHPPNHSAQKCCLRYIFVPSIYPTTLPHLDLCGKNLILRCVTCLKGTNIRGLCVQCCALFLVFLHVLLSSGKCLRHTGMELPSHQTVFSYLTSPSWMLSSWSSSHLEFWIIWSGRLGWLKQVGMLFMPWTHVEDPCWWLVSVWTVTWLWFIQSPTIKGKVWLPVLWWLAWFGLGRLPLALHIFFFTTYTSPCFPLCHS